MRAAGEVDPDFDRIYLDLFVKNMKRKQIPGAGQATSIYFADASSSSTGGSGVSTEELQAMREQITIEMRAEQEQRYAELEMQNAALKAELDSQSAERDAALARQKMELRAEFEKENERMLELLLDLTKKVNRISKN